MIHIKSTVAVVIDLGAMYKVQKAMMTIGKF